MKPDFEGERGICHRHIVNSLAICYVCIILHCRPPLYGKSTVTSGDIVKLPEHLFNDIIFEMHTGTKPKLFPSLALILITLGVIF
jgi:hypothetical protein